MLQLLFVDVSSLPLVIVNLYFFHFIIFFSELTSDCADLYILYLLSITLFFALICIISSIIIFCVNSKVFYSLIFVCKIYNIKHLAASHEWAKLMQPLSSHKF